MGPGVCHAALDNSCSGWNWKKMLGLGPLLEKNLAKAADTASRQCQVADNFTATFPREAIQDWTCMVREWEADPSYPNPYISRENASKVSKARLQLTWEEVAEAERGKETLHKVSPSIFIRAGLELEDQQYGLQSAFAGKAHSNAQKATLLERQIALLHQINKWRELQAVYMPGVPLLVTTFY
ncbi:hypothetical protein BJ322DRAFT_1112591 [Thelephora terrestris]|uniref:Uncharacterized protein n=1 Tax=Thelephora terrestris TaxID=56493 RepID=A0A9P6H8S8_9AGAM|nr:hypothetical protein BJ322DRAFT_1112591 [Thelephora terrestris]